MNPYRASRSRRDAFCHAFSGFVQAFRSQPNIRIHASISAAVVLLAIWLGIGLQGWAILALAMGMVWTAELFNTALEGAVDLASPAEHPVARVAKDAAAAAVLVASAVAVVVGLLILGPPLWMRLAGN